MTEVKKLKINLNTTQPAEDLKPKNSGIAPGNAARANVTELPAGHHPNRPVNVSWSQLRQERKDSGSCLDMSNAMHREWSEAGKPQEYTTKPGDTLWNLAEMVKKDGYYADKSLPDVVKELRSLNNIPKSSSMLLPDKTIKLFSNEEEEKKQSETIENKVQDENLKNSHLESDSSNSPSSLVANNDMTNSSVKTTKDNSPAYASAYSMKDVDVETKGNNSPAKASAGNMQNVDVASTGDNSPAKVVSSNNADNVDVKTQGYNSNATLNGHNIANSTVSASGDRSNATMDASDNGDIKNSSVTVSGKGNKAEVNGGFFGDMDVVVNQDSRLGHTEVHTGKGNNVVTENVTANSTTGNYEGGWSTDIATQNIKTSGNTRTIALGGGSDEAHINFSNGADNNKISLLGDSQGFDITPDTYNVDFSKGKNNTVIVNTITNTWGATAKNDTLVLRGSNFQISEIDNMPGAKYLIKDANGNEAYVGEKVSKLVIQNSEGKVTEEREL